MPDALLATILPHDPVYVTGLHTIQYGACLKAC